MKVQLFPHTRIVTRGATIAGVIREGSLFILGRKITASNAVDVGNTEEKIYKKGKGKKK